MGIQRLDLSNNHLCNFGLSFDRFTELCIAIESNTSLRVLRLERNQLRTQGCWAIAHMLQSSSTCVLQSLDISCNEISPRGAISIAKALPGNQTLRELSLRSNMIDTTAAIALGTALEVNSTLSSLDLENNDVTIEGVKALATSLTKNASVRCVSLIMNEFDSSEAERCLRKIGDPPGCIRAQVLLRSKERVAMLQAE